RRGAVTAVLLTRYVGHERIYNFESLQRCNLDVIVWRCGVRLGVRPPTVVPHERAGCTRRARGIKRRMVICSRGVNVREGRRGGRWRKACGCGFRSASTTRSTNQAKTKRFTHE
ncbi:unnamed protein product, partial [Hapterophycus canaliculatus]